MEGGYEHGFNPPMSPFHLVDLEEYSAFPAEQYEILQQPPAHLRFSNEQNYLAGGSPSFAPASPFRHPDSPFMTDFLKLSDEAWKQSQLMGDYSPPETPPIHSSFSKNPDGSPFELRHRSPHLQTSANDQKILGDGMEVEGSHFGAPSGSTPPLPPSSFLSDRLRTFNSTKDSVDLLLEATEELNASLMQAREQIDWFPLSLLLSYFLFPFLLFLLISLIII